jgi:hypothetical protein
MMVAKKISTHDIDKWNFGGTKKENPCGTMMNEAWNQKGHHISKHAGLRSYTFCSPTSPYSVIRTSNSENIS